MDIYQELREIKQEQHETKELVLKLISRQKNEGYDLDATVCPKEACKLLHCSARKEQGLRSRGILPFTKIDGLIYIKVSAIQALIAKGYTK